MPFASARAATSSLPRLCEISQIRRRLTLSGGHQETVRAEEISLCADPNVHVADVTNILDPMRVLLQSKGFVDRPGACQRVVDRRHFIVNDLRILFVAIDALLHDSPVVRMKRDARIVETA